MIYVFIVAVSILAYIDVKHKQHNLEETKNASTEELKRYQSELSVFEMELDELIQDELHYRKPHKDQ